MAIEFVADVEFAHHQRAELSDTCKTPGFRHIQKIFEAEVDRFFMALMKLPTGSDTAVVEGHRIARVASQLWEGAAQRINNEIKQYSTELSSAKTEAPTDPTDGLMDFGPRATQASLEEEIDIDY